MDKYAYRQYFRDLMKYVKMTTLAKEVGISASSYSKFMMDDYHNSELSLNSLESLKRKVEETLLPMI